MLALFSICGRQRLQRFVEFVERFLLVLGRHLLVGLDLRDLRLDHGFGADIFLGRGIEAAEHEADVVDDVVVIIVAGKAVLLGDAVELPESTFWLGRRVLREFFRDRIHVLLRGEHAVELLVGQRDLLQRRCLGPVRVRPAVPAPPAALVSALDSAKV